MSTENKSALAAAIVAVMKEVKGIEKNMTVGSGNYGYKGVADQDVKKIIGDAMAKHGLCILPINVNATAKIDRWNDNNGNPKQSVFTEVNNTYLLLHESGESVEIAGYGHGVDAQDKGAGKATTYALKYALLYAFMVPTGKIDDADQTHSDEHVAPLSNDEKAVREKLQAIEACKDMDGLKALKGALTDWQKTEKRIYSALSEKFKELNPVPGFTENPEKAANYPTA